MPMRPFKFPDDYREIVGVFPQFYVYPEHPTWSLRQDEIETLSDTANAILRFWPLIRLVQIFVPSLRDYVHGFVWEEEGKIVGVINYGRQGTSNIWWAGNVGVLRQYQGQDIARQLTAASAEDLRRRGAAIVIGDVITENIPAQRLAVSCGMRHFSGQVEMEYTRPEPPPEQPLPDGYEIRPLDWYDWRPRFDLAKRITPESVTKYLPVAESRFRQPPLTRPLRALGRKMMGLRYEGFAVRHNGLVVATAGYLVRTKAGGYNDIEVNLDPAHAALALYLVSAMTGKAVGRHIQFIVQSWQPYVVEAALTAGFVKIREMSKLGMFL
jgi:GNAT superfamily N-acetyltransferase